MQKVIKGRGLVDVARGKVVPDPIVVIDGDKIVAVGSRGERPFIPNESEVLDFSGKYILPGLINSHGHMVLPGDGSTLEAWTRNSNEMLLLTAARNARIALMSGVTTMRDCGGRDGVTYALRNAIERGIVEGPRLFLSGRMLTITGGHCHQFHGEVDGIEGMTRAVRRLIKEGADFIKIIATGGGTIGTRPECAAFGMEEIRAAVETAHRVDKKVAAHCRGIPGMKQAVEAGVDHMEHASFLLPDMTRKFDPGLAESMAKMGMYVTPTLQLGRDTIEALTWKKEAGMMTSLEEKVLEDWHRGLEDGFTCFRELLKAGIQFVAGNDAGWRFTPFDRFWQELDAMVHGGMTPLQAIIGATKTAAEAMMAYQKIGSVEAGKQADIIIVDQDPTLDISGLSKVSLVMKAGEICFLR
jgi:imidazolonepropionase-like amidohydrolase